MKRGNGEAILNPLSARHGRLRRSNGWANAGKVLLTGVIVLALSGISVAAYAVWGLASDLKTVDLVVSEEEQEALDAVAAGSQSLDGALTILLVGSDSREEGSEFNDGETGELNDVNLLLHISADHQNATVVSFPRDLMVPIPSCPSPDGGYYSAMSEQMLNTALSYGGLPCVALTIENLTGLHIPYAGLITFDGVVGISNAIGGVTVCLTEPIFDEYTGLDLAPGDNTLAGGVALQFLRTRHGVGNGGDVSRISNQQIFMSALVRQLQSSDTLGNPVKVYGLAKAGIQNMTLSSNMATVQFMQALAGTVKDIDLERINFVQYPSFSHPYEAGRLTPDYASAQLLFDVLASGQPFEVTGRGEAVVDTSAPAEVPAEVPAEDVPAEEAPVEETEAPPSGPVKLPENITGQSAANQTCSAGRTTY